MSEKTIKRSVGYSVMAALGAMMGLGAAMKAESWSSDRKGKKFRNNFAAVTQMKIKSVRRWRAANRVARASRKYNRQRK